MLEEVMLWDIFLKNLSMNTTVSSQQKAHYERNKNFFALLS